MRNFTLDSSSEVEKAPRIDEFLSAKKKGSSMGRRKLIKKDRHVAEYCKDAVCLLASRIEIQLLKAKKTAFYTLGLNMLHEREVDQWAAQRANEQNSSCVFEGRRDASSFVENQDTQFEEQSIAQK